MCTELRTARRCLAVDNHGKAVLVTIDTMRRNTPSAWWLPGARIIAVAWLAFLISFFLPATNVVHRGGTPPGTPLKGWDAAISSLEVLAAQPLVIFVEPRALLFLFFPFINLAALLSPASAVRSPDQAEWIGALLLLSAIIAICLPKTLTGNRFIGFYLWVGSFALLGIGNIVLSMAARRHFNSNDP